MNYSRLPHFRIAISIMTHHGGAAVVAAKLRPDITELNPDLGRLFIPTRQHSPTAWTYSIHRGRIIILQSNVSCIHDGLSASADPRHLRMFLASGCASSSKSTAMSQLLGSRSILHGWGSPSIVTSRPHQLKYAVLLDTHDFDPDGSERCNTADREIASHDPQ